MISVTRLLTGTEASGDGLRYGRPSEGVHGSSATDPSLRPRSASERRPVVVWNITKTCNLNCLHCYSDSECRSYDGELTTEGGGAVLDDLSSFGVPAVLFSGGEPLVREDLFHLVSKARNLGLRFTLSTNGTLIDREKASRIKEAGFSYVGISLDGVGEVNDRFRGVEGAFERALAGIRNCHEVGQKVGLRMTLTAHNASALPEIRALVERERIRRVCFYHLVYAGRGGRIAGDDLSPAKARAAIDEIFEWAEDLAARGEPTEILTVDNHVDGVYLLMRLRERNPERADEVEALLRWNGGGMYSSGVGIGCIDPVGDVHPNQFWTHHTIGSVKERPFSEIWTDESDPILSGLRRRREMITGRCSASVCKWFDLCGGSLRVRSELSSGDPWGPDPACYLTDEEISR